mgnify:CR=1 FL=1
MVGCMVCADVLGTISSVGWQTSVIGAIQYLARLQIFPSSTEWLACNVMYAQELGSIWSSARLPLVLGSISRSDRLPLVLGSRPWLGPHSSSAPIPGPT